MLRLAWLSIFSSLRLYSRHARHEATSQKPVRNGHFYHSIRLALLPVNKLEHDPSHNLFVQYNRVVGISTTSRAGAQDCFVLALVFLLAFVSDK